MHRSLLVRSERPGWISGLPGGLSRSHLPRSLPVRVPALLPRLQRLPSCWTERRRGRREEGEEEERPQRASETCVGLRFVLQGHTGSYQGTKSQRHVRGSVEDSGVHVGQPGGGAETGEGTAYSSFIYPSVFLVSEVIMLLLWLDWVHLQGNNNDIMADTTCFYKWNSTGGL